MSAPMSPDAALVRLRQYEERPASTWSTASYGGGATESALAEIGRTLADEVGRLRAELQWRPTRAEADAELQAAAAGLREAWTAEVEHVQRQLSARPARNDVLREVADYLDEVREKDAAYLVRTEDVTPAAVQAESGGAR